MIDLKDHQTELRRPGSTRVTTTRSKIVGGVLSMCAVATILIWTIFISGKCSITNVQIAGNVFTPTEEIRAAVMQGMDASTWRPWDRRNYFFVKPDDVARRVQDALFAENVEIEKKWPNVLRLKIKERQRSVVVGVRDQLFEMDSHGVVLGTPSTSTIQYIQQLVQKNKIAETNRPPYILIANEITLIDSSTTTGVIDMTTPTMANVATGSVYMAPGVVQGWIKAYRTLDDAQIRFRWLTCDANNPTFIDIQTTGGFVIRVDTETNPEEQIQTAVGYLRTQPLNKQPLEYIDVRVQGKMYVK